MPEKQVLQAGRRVIIDSKGNKTYEPFPTTDDSGTQPTPGSLGSGAAAAAAQALLDAQSKREAAQGMKKGGKVKSFAKGGPVRDGIAQRGKTRGKYI